jgi:two-component system, NtrC family, response regulator AtoC
MSANATRILIVDDEDLLRWSLRRELERAGYVCDEASTAAAALEQAAREAPDLVLLDYRLPDRTGFEVLRSLRKSLPRLPVVMLTAHASIDGAVEAMREGAYDYLTKPFEIEQVLLAVQRATEASRLREELALQRELGAREWGLQNLIAESRGMKEVVRLVQRIAKSEASTILLLGESGVGKGLVARALHFEGDRREKPFLNITCTALPETLLESELFGHERGAFTDAKTQKKGLFELADGGTVFLDEIGDISPALQGKLLRVLEEKVFRRVGGNRDIKVSVRIIAATNKNLEKELEDGRFRPDLYFRLRVIPVLIPPLRERTEDVLPLARSFLRHFNAEFGKSLDGFDAAAESQMLAYRWPGNVRELRNAIERAALLADGDRLTLQDLPVEIRPAPEVPTASSQSAGEVFTLPPGGLVFEELEKELLRQALARSSGNRTRAARLLGLNRDRIRYRIQKFGLEEVAPEAM